MSDPRRTDTGLWPLMLAPGAALPDDRAALVAAAGRLVELIGPALAKFLLAPAEARLGAALVDPARAETARRLNRLNAAVQARWARAIGQAGIPFVALKGFASARTLYPDADLRATGDFDILVRESDRDRLIVRLEAEGFAFAGAALPRWGFISDASYVPFVSADGACNLDIHVRPDSWPAHRSLTTERVFAAAREIEARDGTFLAPAPAHALALCITNAAKDKFGPFAALKLIDAARLAAANPPPDWDVVARLAREGRFLKPARVFISLLAALGMPAPHLPPGLARPPGGVAGPAFVRLVADWRAVFPGRAGAGAVAWRELALCTEPEVGLHNAWLRLRGLVRPGTGMPAAPRQG